MRADDVRPAMRHISSEGRSTVLPSGKIRVRPDRVVTLSERLYLLRSGLRRERIKFVIMRISA
jgi:hypothetical protein